MTNNNNNDFKTLATKEHNNEAKNDSNEIVNTILSELGSESLLNIDNPDKKKINQEIIKDGCEDPINEALLPTDLNADKERCMNSKDFVWKPIDSKPYFNQSFTKWLASDATKELTEELKNLNTLELNDQRFKETTTNFA